MPSQQRARSRATLKADRDARGRDHYSPTEQRVYCVPPAAEQRSEQGPFNSACAFPARFPKHFDRCGWSIHCQAPWKKYACWAKGDGAQPWQPADLVGKSVGPLQSTLRCVCGTFAVWCTSGLMRTLAAATASRLSCTALPTERSRSSARLPPRRWVR
jgi:hypothetical protein